MSVVRQGVGRDSVNRLLVGGPLYTRRVAVQGIREIPEFVWVASEYVSCVIVLSEGWWE